MREVMGSWKIMAIRSPRRRRRASGGRVRRSCPPKSMVPPATWPLGGRSPSTDRAVTLLPQPDSPTRPTMVPRGTVRSTPSTAGTRPWGPGNPARRPEMARVGGWCSMGCLLIWFGEGRGSFPGAVPFRAETASLIPPRL